MNYNPLSRRPLSEAIKKHGSSKMFLWAIILSFASAVLMPFIMVYEVYGLTLQEDLLHELNFSTEETVILFIIVFIIAVGAAVPSVLMNIGLLRGYRYFSGKTPNSTGFDFYLKVYKITLIVCAVILGLFYLPIIAGSIFSGEFFVMAIFVLPILAGICVGLGFLYYYEYKAIEKAMNYATCAAADVNYGEISTFLIVITIIGVASSASSIIQLPAGITTNLTINGDVYASSVVSVLASVPSLIANIFYLVLMFRFKADMNAAKNEWDWIQRQKASIELANAKAAEAARLQSEPEQEESLASQEGEQAESESAAAIEEGENQSPAVAEEAQQIESKETKPQDDGNGDGDISDNDIFVD